MSKGIQSEDGWLARKEKPMTNITWQKEAHEKFKQMIAKVPVFMRPLAQETVSKKVRELVLKDNRSEITEKDMVDAFFSATPGGFHGPMKVDMEDLGIDYTKYGYEKDPWRNIMGGKRDKKE